jgi:hypothetical protein
LADARGLFGAALVETALVTWRDVAKEKVPPPPSDYVAVAIIYGLLALLPDSGQGFANVVGWGLVVATLLNFWTPATPTKFGPPTTPTIQGAI